ncbi:MAG: hypothetical protein ACM3UT_09085 [Chloroflexota bacterium]
MLKIRGISLLIFLTLYARCLTAQGPDYEAIFGDDWRKAEEFESENRHWMEPLLEQNNIPYRLAISVVFPELVRYSALRDKMETTLLKALYVNLGDEYANFSIGQFQIKPSFASIIRMEAPRALGRRSEITFMQPEEFDDISNYRKSIITDLGDPKTQFNYVIAFFKICEKKYKTGKMHDEEKLKFLSTAYNYGIDKSSEQIRSMISRKFFSTKIIRSVTYCYSDISLYRYKQTIVQGLVYGK